MAVVYWIGGTGSQSWNTGANWSGSAVPTTGDDVVLRDAESLIDTGLAQSAVTLASLTVEDSFSGAIGSETTPLAISATVVRVDGGVTRFNIDLGTNASAVLVKGNGTSLDDGLAAVRVKANHASTTVSVTGGEVAVGLNTPADTATVATLNARGGTLAVGRGVTWAAIVNNGGTVTADGGGTTVTTIDGETFLRGVGTVTTINALGGTTYADLRPTSGTTVTTLNLKGGTFDTTGNPAAITLANTVLRSGRINAFSASQITHTNPSIDTGDLAGFGVSAD